MNEKIKIYLDTNMILDVFINHAKAVKKGEDVLVPKKYEFMIANKEKIEFVTSFLTQAETIRELTSGYGVSYEDILHVLNSTIKYPNLPVSHPCDLEPCSILCTYLLQYWKTHFSLQEMKTL